MPFPIFGRLTAVLIALNTSVWAQSSAPDAAAGSIWNRERLVGTPAPVRDLGLDLRLDVTQFANGRASGGKGDRTRAYGGKLDFTVRADAAPALGWNRLALTAHLERVYGRDLNGAGGGP